MFNESALEASLVSEKLRMSVGLKLNDDISLNLLFLKNSLPFLGKLPDDSAESGMIHKSLDMMTKLGVTIYTEKDDSGNVEFQNYIEPHIFELADVDNVLKNAKRIIT